MSMYYTYVCICIYLLNVSMNQVTYKLDNKSVLLRLISIHISYVNNIYDVKEKIKKDKFYNEWYRIESLFR